MVRSGVSPIAAVDAYMRSGLPDDNTIERAADCPSLHRQQIGNEISGIDCNALAATAATAKPLCHLPLVAADVEPAEFAGVRALPCRAIILSLIPS